MKNETSSFNKSINRAKMKFGSLSFYATFFICLIIFWLIFIVPVFEDIFSDIGSDLNFLSKNLFMMSHIFTRLFLLILPPVIILVPLISMKIDYVLSSKSSRKRNSIILISVLMFLIVFSIFFIIPLIIHTPFDL